jgi:hypothetical protein
MTAEKEDEETKPSGSSVRWLTTLEMHLSKVTKILWEVFPFILGKRAWLDGCLSMF